jgi:hypothetical protein
MENEYSKEPLPAALELSERPDHDPSRFEVARLQVLDPANRAGGIGTLGEKALHAIVKSYLEPDQARHEQKLGPYVVDILTKGQVIEIQTRQFGKLRPKLDALLPDYPMTLVLPIPARKWLLWVDPASGEIRPPRLSPRRGSWQDAFAELVRIKPYLNHPNLSVLLLLIDLEEYRLLNGWSTDRKRGAWRHDRLPLRLVESLRIEGPADFANLLPPGLPERFTSADYAKAAAIRRNRAQTALNVLKTLGLVLVCGKQGRMTLYRMP